MGDVLYIHSLDRFGRDKEDILQERDTITKEIQADIIVLDMPLLDTTQYKGSMETFIAGLVLQILFWVAQDECELIQKRQGEKIDASQRKGVQFGRPRARVTEDFIDAYHDWEKGNMVAVQTMKQANVKKTTFYKLAKRVESKIKWIPLSRQLF